LTTSGRSPSVIAVNSAGWKVTRLFGDVQVVTVGTPFNLGRSPVTEMRGVEVLDFGF
jgi:hypothetical protein